MFTVLWGPEATEELTRLWLQADAAMRKRITAASHAIDKVLASEPDNTGESRPDGARIHFEFPLGIRFDVDNSSRTVSVLQVWQFRKRK